MPTLNISLNGLKNAVLYKDMLVAAKRKKLVTGLFLMNMFFSITISILIAVVNIMLIAGEQPPAIIYTYAFMGVIIFECAVMVFSIPSLTAPSVANEREQQTLNVLLLSGLSYRKIIWGKFLSACVYLFLIQIASLPFMAIVFAYGGVSFWQVILIVIGMMFITMYMSAIGIKHSVFSKKATKAGSKTFFVLFTLVIGLPILLTIIFAISTALKYIIYPINTPPAHLLSDYLCFLLYLNPATTMIDIIDRVVGFNFSFANYKGMSFIISNVYGFSPNNFFLKLWTPISIVCQASVGLLALHSSSKGIDPTRKRKYRVSKKKHNS